MRETIELLCCILRDNGMSAFQAETLRKAKFDQADACAALWKLLFELIFFCQHRQVGTPMLTAFTTMKTDDRVIYVKKEMQRSGYMSRVFAALPPDMSHGSRELLLAFAWLLNKESIIHKFMDNRASPIQDDVLSLCETKDSEHLMNLPTFGDKQQSPAHRIQQMLVLNNKVKFSLRLLHAAQQEHATLTHRIHNATYGVSLLPDMNHLTTFQVQMLRHPQQMKRVISLLEQDSIRLENLLHWEDKETMFWEWLESVLELKLQQQASSRVSDENSDSREDGVATRTVFLDVPPTLAADIAESRQSLMSMILHYESAIEKLEDLWTTKKSTVSQWELDRLLASINAEISQLQSCIGKEPESAKSLPPPGLPQLVLVKNKSSGSHAPAKLSNTLAASVQGAVDRNSNERPKVSIHDEISRLQQEAGMLESELMDMRRDCLQRLNKIVAGAPNTICILPPNLRKLCQ